MSLAKPKFGDKCNGCGLCCAAELCELAEDVFPGASAPCPALEWEDGRAWCGMIRHPSRHLQLDYTGADSAVGPLYEKGIGAGQGCGMPDEDISLQEKVSSHNMSLREELDKMRDEERNEPRDDGYDFYVSDHAYVNALKFIPLMEQYPMPHLASSGAAEVVFAFTRKTEHRPCVRVNFRGKPDERDYIYYDFGKEHDAVDLTEAALVDSLDRLFAE